MAVPFGSLPGVSLGLKVGSAIHGLLAGGSDGMVIAHRLKGRRRYTCRGIKGQPEACAALEAELSRFPGMRSARVSPVTGSITVTYEQRERVIDALFDALSHQVAGKHAVQESTVIPTGLVTASNNLNDLLNQVVSLAKRFMNHTEPMFWTRIAGLALVAFGVTKVMRGERPSGPQLALWGIALLLRQTHPDPKSVLGAPDDSLPGQP
ncbi:MAG: hypothetical protein K6A65_07025 [Succinivibrionaceae bacterium]|nr:hypothetical protein [Succinivibrionaceae bacterium]